MRETESRTVRPVSQLNVSCMVQAWSLPVSCACDNVYRLYCAYAFSEDLAQNPYSGRRGHSLVPELPTEFFEYVYVRAV